MRSMKKFGTAVAAASMAMALVGASSASAATWDPQNTVVHGHGVLTLNAGASVTCTVTTNVKATGDRATTTNAAGADAGPTFSGCTNSLGLSPTTVTSSSAWVATATSTSSVDVTNGNAVINIGGVCTVTASNVSVPNNAWSNATHTLTPNSGVSFPLTRSGFCLGVNATGTMSGSITFPAASIT